ncbi:MAG: DUF1320 domain-containing protein [Candidatus Accumulibacter sp.]|jgi:phage gp36-like protein|nr:DUF1320 domain-containing protein [Accumulibacter sp.]
MKKPTAYATLADLYARFGEDEINQVADTDRTGTPDPVLVARALEDASMEIDAALTGRYALPLIPVPTLITRVACELARESLYSDTSPKNVEERAKWARQTLRNIASGTLRLESLKPAQGGKAQTDARWKQGRVRMQWP